MIPPDQLPPSGANPVPRLLEGWGMICKGRSQLYRPRTLEEVGDALSDSASRRLSVIARGSGFSYGDAALNDGQAVIDTTGLNSTKVESLPEQNIDVQTGTTIEALCSVASAHGLWPGVVPGTAFPTVGGCIGANVHGKNNWLAGAFGDHVMEIELMLASGEVVRCSRSAHPDLFKAVIGGYGLLGVVLSARLHLEALESMDLHVEEMAAPNFEALLQIFELRQVGMEYGVGWLDGFASGASLGRGLVQICQTAPTSFSGDGQGPFESGPGRAKSSYSSGIEQLRRKAELWRLLKPLSGSQSLRILNSARYNWGMMRSGHVSFVPRRHFHFMLDTIPDWRRAFQPLGLLQFQMFVPRDECLAVFSKVLERMQQQNQFPILAVVKRHRTDDFLLSYGVDGYSLSLDFHVTAANRDRLTRELLQLAREVVLPAGGRFYPAKDSILSREDMEGSYGADAVEAFRRLKSEWDPESRFTSDLYRRLFLPQA